MSHPAVEPLPPIELAAAEHLTGLPVAITRGTEQLQVSTFGVVRVGTDMGGLVDEHGAVVACRTIGGLRVSWQLQARLAIDVYALTYSDAWAAQAVIEAHLADRHRRTGSRRRIDSWTNESAGAEQPYPNGDLSVITSIWRVSSRQLSA